MQRNDRTLVNGAGPIIRAFCNCPPGPKQSTEAEDKYITWHPLSIPIETPY